MSTFAGVFSGVSGDAAGGQSIALIRNDTVWNITNTTLAFGDFDDVVYDPDSIVSSVDEPPSPIINLIAGAYFVEFWMPVAGSASPVEIESIGDGTTIQDCRSDGSSGLSRVGLHFITSNSTPQLLFRASDDGDSNGSVSAFQGLIKVTRLGD